MRTVPPPPWRIVFVSQALPAVLGFDAFARSLGHEPVAIVTSQGVHGRRQPRASGSRDFFNRLINEAPADLDIVIPHDRTRVPALIAPFEPDLILCAGFPWRLPPEVLELPPVGAVNSHPSLLPRHRGPAPLAWAIRDGDAELGLTFHRMDPGFDTGAILAQGTVPLGADDGPDEIFPKLASLAPELLPRVFERLTAGDPGDPQDEALASYAGPFGDDYVEIDWTQPARAVHAQVRAWRLAFGHDLPGPMTELDGRRVRVVRSRIEHEPNDGPPPGTIVRRDGAASLVKCGEGALWVLETDPPT